MLNQKTAIKAAVTSGLIGSFKRLKLILPLDAIKKPIDKLIIIIRICVLTAGRLTAFQSSWLN